MCPLVHCAHMDSNSWHSHMSELALAPEHSELLLLRFGTLCHSLPGSPLLSNPSSVPSKPIFSPLRVSTCERRAPPIRLSAGSVRALIDFVREKCTYYYYYYYYYINRFQILPGWPCTRVPDRAMPLRD